MDTIYQRYLNGDCEMVWNEINSKSLTQLSEFETEQIQLILKEAFDRIKRNSMIVFKILQETGFVYVNFGSNNALNTPYVLSSKENEILLSVYQSGIQNFGFIPLSIIEFYKTFSVLDFRGEFNTFDLDFLLDPLYIFPIDVFIGLNADPFEIHMDESTIYYLFFCPDEFVKEDTSGDVGYGIFLNKNKLVDCSIHGYKLEMTFIEYLRFCFHWACFPNLKWIDKQRIPDELKNVLARVRNEIENF